MTDAAPGWELYRSFLAVVREGSLSAAARDLNQAQPTIGRHIAELEAQLGGLMLFTRSPRGLRPTEAAMELLPHAEAMSAAAKALVRAASGEREAERGTVRITASEMIGAEVLPAILADFHRAHPDIAVELILSNRTEDLLRREADIAVRMVQPTQTALLARPLGEISLSLHAHPRYLAERGQPEDLKSLIEDHALIGFDTETPSVRSVLALGLPLRREMFAFRADSDLAQFAALRAGFGVGVCQNGLGRREGLASILPQAFSFALPMWLVMHEDLRASRRMRLMFDHLAQSLGVYIRTSGPYR